MNSMARSNVRLLLLLTSFCACPALASVITTDGDLYPTPSTRIQSQNSVQFNPVSIDLVDPGGNRTVVSLSTIPAGGATVVSLLVDLNHTIQIGPPGSQIFVDSFLNVNIPVRMTRQGSTETFDTEMLALTLASPRGDYLMRLDAARPSTGLHQVTDLGGGLFQVDSFFDVFFELSIDGGNSFLPAQGPMRLEMVPVPESSALLLGALGLAMFVVMSARWRGRPLAGIRPALSVDSIAG